MLFKTAPGDRGTYVSLVQTYDPPGGALGKLAAKLMQREPGIQARRDLRRFKQLMETGEVDNQRIAVRPASPKIPRKRISKEARPMRALTWHGRHDVRVDTVPDPEIVNPRDAILKVTSTAICGSDLHLYDGYIPTMRAGDILGHEFMGEVVETSSKSTLKKGQRVVVPFTVSCGNCFFCKKQQYSACDNSNPSETSDASMMLMGHPMGGAFGYAHLTGGYAGGQAEYVRVPYSDVGPIVVPDHLDDDQVLFLSDILPTGWMAAENAQIEPGDTIAVWGCGPVGLFAIQSALIMGAARVIAIDHFPTRLELAKKLGAEIIHYHQANVRDALNEMTGGIGPDAVIDCVGMESHGLTIDNIADQVKAQLYPRDRTAARAAPGNSRLPQGRSGLDTGRLWRLRRQVPARPADGERADGQNRSDPRPEIHQAAARNDRAGEDRHDLPHFAPREPRSRAGNVQALARRAKQLHENRAEDGDGQRAVEETRTPAQEIIHQELSNA